jgi:hypothetical protein
MAGTSSFSPSSMQAGYHITNASLLAVLALN